MGGDRRIGIVSAILMMIVAQSLQIPSANLVTIGVLSNPAEGELAKKYYQGDPFSFLPGSVADYIGTIGGHPIMIPFDVDWEKLQYILDRIDGLVLWSEGTSSPYFNEVSEKAFNYCLQKNTNGNKYPILAIGSAMHTIIKASGNTQGLICSTTPTRGLKSLTIYPLFSTSQFFNAMDMPKLSESIFPHPSMYYTHRCTISPEEFTKNEYMNREYQILGVSREPSPQVGIIEHRKYPIIGVLFHPEKNIYERGDLYSELYRNDETITFCKAIMRRIAQIIRASGNPRLFKEISSQVKQYFSMYRPYELPMVDEYERIVSFQRFNNLQ